MKEIKAYIHRTCIANVIEAVKATSAWAPRSGDAGWYRSRFRTRVQHLYRCP